MSEIHRNVGKFVGLLKETWKDCGDVLGFRVIGFHEFLMVFDRSIDFFDNINNILIPFDSAIGFREPKNMSTPEIDFVFHNFFLVSAVIVNQGL